MPCDSSLAPALPPRRDSAATVAGGSLNWPVEDTDLVGDQNTAGVLSREAPRGAYVVETKLTLGLGQDTVRNYQQILR